MPGEFWGDEFLSGVEWRRTERGSYVRIQAGELTATVFERTGGWGGVSNIFESPRFIRGARDTPEAAAELLVEAEREGVDSPLWAPPNMTDWAASKPTKDRPGFWRKRAGVILAVRQWEPHPSGRYPPSWGASINAGAVLNANGKPWFRSAEEAMMACDAEYERRASTSQQWR